MGGTDSFGVDVRVIAATNRDLGSLIGGGRFREDLFYRLSVVTLQVPPLRERREDIPLLAAYFLGKYAAASGRPVTAIAPEAMALLGIHRRTLYRLTKRYGISLSEREPEGRDQGAPAE